MTMPDLTPGERALVRLLVDDALPPAGIAAALDSDLGTVLDTTKALQERGLLERQAFDTCRLTERGREVAATVTS